MCGVIYTFIDVGFWQRVALTASFLCIFFVHLIWSLIFLNFSLILFVLHALLYFFLVGFYYVVLRPQFHVPSFIDILR